MNRADLLPLFFEHSGHAQIAVDLERGVVLTCNRAFQTLAGMGREDLEGESFGVLTPHSDATESQNQQRPFSLELVRQPGLYHDVLFHSRNGDIHYVTATIHHLRTSEEHAKIALISLDDQTEKMQILRDLAMKHQTLETAFLDLESIHHQLKENQERLQQASKLMALGQMAAGISHEMNQPLTGIRGFAQEISDLVRHGSYAEVPKYVEEITHNVDRMAKLLSHLREFSRNQKTTESHIQPEQFKQIHLTKVFEHIHQLFESQLSRRHVQLRFRGADAVPAFQSDDAAIEQILINLISNARDAILEKTSPGAEKPPRAEKPGHILVHVESNSSHIKIRVTDNGPGIPANIRQSIFNPFFTTKAPDKGLGLGLSISFGIAKALGGELVLEESSAQGTSFVLMLPRRAQQERAA